MISWMRPFVAAVPVIAFVCTSVFGQTSASSAGAERTGNADNGKKLFANYYCYACHGTVGQGGRDGARIAPNPPSITTITRYIRKPTGQMPPYTSKVLSDQDIADIYAFLKAIPASPPAGSIPLLNQ